LEGLTFAQVVTPGVTIYRFQPNPATGMSPSRFLDTGFVFLSVARAVPEKLAGSLFYRLRSEEYVSAKSLAIYSPSTFHGLRWLTQPTNDTAWVLWDTRVSPAPGMPPSKTVPIIPRYRIVTLKQVKVVSGSSWYQIGEGEWLSQYRLAIVKRSAPPPQIPSGEKWIDVNLFEQTLAGFEGDRMVYSTLISSGLPKWDTAPGLFRIWGKVQKAKMTGQEGAPDFYYLEDVPWTMYFNRDTALHAAYWHDGFGSPHSHGCVNLAPADAMWLFQWASPAETASNWTFASAKDRGTWIWVHY
jgi:hypothetical protein